jgi:UDP-N-acetylglucosamine 2-epimerase (non-hydrolysing)
MLNQSAEKSTAMLPSWEQTYSSQIKCLIIIGTESEAIKMLPVISALRDSDNLEPIVIATGEDDFPVHQVLDMADIPLHADLQIQIGPGSTNGKVSTVIERLEEFCASMYRPIDDRVAAEEEVMRGDYPAVILVHGDSSSSLGASISAANMRIPVMHIEAGLRANINNLPDPSELNRQIISRIACFHFAPTLQNEQNLVREGISSSRVLVTGNTIIDSLQWAAKLELPFEDPHLAALAQSNNRIVLVMAGSKENQNNGGLRRIATAVRNLAEQTPDTSFVVPLNNNPEVIKELGDNLAGAPNLIATEPLDYISFAQLLERSHVVITDFGKLQEEAPSFNKPVLVAREQTDRKEALSAGTVTLTGTSVASIEESARKILQDDDLYQKMASADNPYGDGHASDRIITALGHIYTGGLMPCSFDVSYRKSDVLANAGYGEVLQGMWGLKAA